MPKPNEPVFHELYGEIPYRLLSAIKRYKVTPAEFYMMEAMNLSGTDMWTHIIENSPNGYYQAPLF
jgi:hypothetical protein